MKCLLPVRITQISNLYYNIWLLTGEKKKNSCHTPWRWYQCLFLQLSIQSSRHTILLSDQVHTYCLPFSKNPLGIILGLGLLQLSPWSPFTWCSGIFLGGTGHRVSNFSALQCSLQYLMSEVFRELRKAAAKCTHFTPSFFCIGNRVHPRWLHFSVSDRIATLRFYMYLNMFELTQELIKIWWR